MTRTMAAALAALALATVPGVAQAAGTVSYSSLVVFGDSLVDAGNLNAATGGTYASPSQGYQNGRFTNGYDYTDLLSQALFGTVTTASLKGGSNYAFGGATILNNGDAIPDLDAQLATYRTASGGNADATGLYVLNLGGNDIFALQQGKYGTYSSASDYLTAAAADYAGGVQQLSDWGARNILITGFPVPGSLSEEGEADLTTALANLNLAAGTNVYRFSYLDFFNQVQTDPSSLGLPTLNLDGTCQAAKAYPSCGNYFSFDGTHPTAIVQQALFRDLQGEYGFGAAVPEPASWVMMILGVGLAGVALRRRAGAARGAPAIA